MPLGTSYHKAGLKELPVGVERRRRGQQRMKWLYNTTNSIDMSLSKLWEMVMDREVCCSPWGCKVLDMTE